MSRMGDEETALLFHELTDFERQGVGLLLDDWPASPLQIAQAHTLREDVVFMRDYVLDDQGNIEKLCFNVVKLK